MFWGRKKKRGSLLSIRKNCEVEVSSEEEEFKGSWYRAIIEENPTRREHKKLRVRYTTLFEDDGSTPITKTLNRSLIRPVPPEILYNDVVLEEGSVVDAYLKSGWWIGLVVKKMEKEKYLVYFDLKSDSIEIQRMELRAHFDWTGSKWVRPDNKQLTSSDFSPGTMVELRNDFTWVPVMIIEELENEKKFLVEYCKKFFNSPKKSRIIVDFKRVRPKQPLFPVEKYELLDRVEVFSGCVWRQGVVREILTEGLYIVSYVATKEVSQFSHLDLRPLMEWKYGVWHKRQKPKLEEGISLDGERNKSNEKMLEEHNNTRKRNRGELDFNEKVLSSSDQTSNMVKDSSVDVEDPQAKYTKMLVLPFAKKLSFWKKYETNEVFKRALPQNPHFSPLLKRREHLREGAALGLIMSFFGLLKEVKDLKPDVTISELHSFKVSFGELEEHGFDVTMPLSRIDKLLALKDRQLNVMEKLKGIDKEMADESSKQLEAEEEFSEIEHKILGLQREEMVLREHKEAVRERKDVTYKKVCELESCAIELGVELEDVELEIETTLSGPW